MPDALLHQIRDLDNRVRPVRDHIEHVKLPLSMRLIDATGEELVVSTRRVVPSGEDAEEMIYESPPALRNAIHAYVRSILELLESARKVDGASGQ